MILLRHAHLHAPEDFGTQDVLLGGGRILAIADSLPSPDPTWGVEEVECDGLLLAPGLIDAHTHLSGGGGEGGARTRVPAVGLSSFTLAGVSTAIGLLGTDCTTRSIGELLACARALGELGFNALCYTGGYAVPPPTLTGSVRGDLVHIDRIVAIGEIAISDHRSSQPTFEELARLAADAHIAGMMTEKAGLLHLHVGDGPRGLDLIRRMLHETELPSRVFHPTHLNRNPRLWDEAKRTPDIPIDVTAFPPDDDDVISGHAVADWFHAGLDMRRLTMSSDGGGCLPTFSPSGELLAMDVGSSHWLLPSVAMAVGEGVPLANALATVTSNVASLFRLRGKGRLVAGHDADCLLLRPDLSVHSLIVGGRWMVRNGRASVRGPFEPAESGADG
jgi:beta-aspartyl-dipeptidase (metallo-type)